MSNIASAGKFGGGFSMSLAETKPLQFFPPTGPASETLKAGFRFGSKGTHSSRTLMFADLEAVLSAASEAAGRDEYSNAIIEGNCLHKQTASTRRLSNQRLGELYALDRSCAVFRVMRRLWRVADHGRPQLAMLAALARDPLLMASAQPIVSLSVGAELQRAAVRDALRELIGERMNDAVIDKVVRNVSSSWKQTGHLEGRTFKFRQRIEASPAAVAFALYLGYSAGFRGDELLTSGWIAVLDCTASSAKALALEAKSIGLIDLSNAEEVLEFRLERLDPGIRGT